MPQHEPCDPVRRTLIDDIRARVLHHLAEVNTGRAHRFTRAAVETSKHVLAERVGNLRAALVERAHEIDTSARGIHLAAEHTVRRTRRQAQATVNAVEVKLILRRCGGQG